MGPFRRGTYLIPFVVAGCLGSELDAPESTAKAALPADLTLARKGSRALVDGQRTIEARDLDRDEVDDPPEYTGHWEADGVAPDYEQLYASIRRVTVTVDVDYPRADAVGIWLSSDNHDVQLRAPTYYTPSQTAYRQTFTTTEFAGDRAFANLTLRIAGTEAAVARDCYNEESSSSWAVSASNSGVFRSRSITVAQSKSWTTRRCQEFFRPLSVKNVRITIEYDVPPVAMPTRSWDLSSQTAYTNDTKWFELAVAPSVPPPYIMSGISVNMVLWCPPSMGEVSVVLVNPASTRVVIWSSREEPAERDDTVTIDRYVHDFDEQRMDGTWRLELVHKGEVAPGTTYELKNALIVLNPTTRPPVSWRSTPLQIESPHPYFARTTQTFDVVAPEGAIACRLGFGRVDLEFSLADRLTILSPEGAELEQIRGGLNAATSNIVSDVHPGNHFVLKLETGGVPDWGFRLDELICKY